MRVNQSACKITVCARTGQENHYTFLHNLKRLLVYSKIRDVCKNKKMSFLWVFPDGEQCMQSEKIRTEFIAFDVNCPGLYYVSEENDFAPVCVVPGYVSR